MSVQKSILIIEPPLHQEVREVKHFKDYTCPVCNGQGGFPEQTGPDQYKTNPCDYCCGAGKVNAEVTVNWKPVYQKELKKDTCKILFPDFGFTNYIPVIETFVAEEIFVSLEAINCSYITFVRQNGFTDELFDDMIGRLMVELIRSKRGRLQSI